MCVYGETFRGNFQTTTYTNKKTIKKSGGSRMNQTTNWWEDLFQGPISLGLNKDRLTELEEEQFIYFASTEDAEAMN